LAVKYYRFKSLPEALDLEFPIITPSGLAIGIIKKLVLFLNSSASSALLDKKLIKPFNT